MTDNNKNELPERLKFLDRIHRFLDVIEEAARQGKLTEMDFYLILGTKCKAMNQERRENKAINR